MDKERILVVEDEPRVAQALCRVLTLPEGGGYQVESCDSGEAALERLPRGRFDLLVTDLSMPGLSGLDLLHHARELSPKTRTILITAYGSPDVEQRAKEIADAYIPKPFTMKAFVQTVRQILTLRPSSASHAGRISANDTQAIQERIDLLRLDLGALGVMVLDQEGHILADCGQRPDFDTNTVLALLGNTMLDVNQVVQVLGEDEAFDLNLHQGKRYDIYTGRINAQAFICLVLDRFTESGSPFGMVWLSLRRAITDLRELLVKSNLLKPAPAKETPRPTRTASDMPATKPSPKRDSSEPSSSPDSETLGDQYRSAGSSKPEPRLKSIPPLEPRPWVTGTPSAKPEPPLKPTPPPEPKPWPAALAPVDSKPRPEITPSAKPDPQFKPTPPPEPKPWPAALAPVDSKPRVETTPAPVEPARPAIEAQTEIPSRPATAAEPTPVPTPTANVDSASSAGAAAATESQQPSGPTTASLGEQPVDGAAFGESERLFHLDSIPESAPLLSYEEAIALGILNLENLPSFLLPPEDSDSVPSE